MRKSPWWLFFACAAMFTLAVFVVFLKFHEGRAYKSIPVNLVKRLAAEAGARISGIFFPDTKGDVNYGPGVPNGSNILPLGVILKKTGGLSKVVFKDHPVSEYAKNFDYEDYLAPPLIKLREEYALDDLTVVAGDELEKFIILRGWLRKFIARGKPSGVDYNFNALDILARARMGEKFFCSEYATVFVQCALSLGFIGRYVGLFEGHVVAEVFSDQFVKWVVMDVDRDLHFEKNGVPLGALELHRLSVSGDYSGVRALRGFERTEVGFEERDELIGYYHDFYVRMRDDWFSRRYPHWHHKGNSIMNGLEWRDKYTKNNILVARSTGNEDELNFPLNTVAIYAKEGSVPQKGLNLVFGTFTPGFAYFKITVDGVSFLRQATPEFLWRTHPGLNTLSVNSVNIMGVLGPVSSVEFYYVETDDQNSGG